MGGRKSYDASTVVGSDDPTRKKIRKLKKSIKEDNSKKVVFDSYDIVRNSRLSINNLKYLIHFKDEINELARIARDKPSIKRREIITDFWIKTKKEKNIKTTSEVDNLIITSALTAISGGGGDSK